jgi:hypothetical protein
MTTYRFNEARFWAKVTKTDTCWNWTGCATKGYGMSRAWRDDKYTMVLSHRLSYYAARGECPDDMYVDHVCHNPACVRPEHLRLVTNKQNSENVLGAQSNSESGIRGVRWESKSKRWRARVTHNRQCIEVGYFDTAQAAADAVKAKRNELFTHNDLDRVA